MGGGGMDSGGGSSWAMVSSVCVESEDGASGRMFPQVDVGRGRAGEARRSSAAGASCAPSVSGSLRYTTSSGVLSKRSVDKRGGASRIFAVSFDLRW